MKYQEFEEKAYEKLRVLNETLWEYKIDKKKIVRWLNNFKNDEEKMHALYLLPQFMYFGNLQMRELLRGLYRDLYRYRIIERIRLNNGNTTNKSFIDTEYERVKLNTRFLGVGNPSESGIHLLYYFRQENQLPKSLFVNANEVIDRIKYPYPTLNEPYVEEYVFFDDFCGTGTQAKMYSDRIVSEIKRIDPKVNISYLMLFATKNGKDYVRNNTKFDYVEAVFELDDSFKCFSDTSRYFYGEKPDFIDKSFAESIFGREGLSMMEKFFEKEGLDAHLVPMHAENSKLGFGDCQLLIGFNHNTPDNTLPIFWWDEKEPSWYPIFKRYNKIYQ